MCGIIGVVVKDNLWKLDVKNYITQGLMASSVRGEDGTGVFVVTDKGEVQIYKKPYPSWDYLQLPKYTELLEQDIDLLWAIPEQAHEVIIVIYTHIRFN